MLPLLLVLLLMAIDFGRVYFGWVTLTNASRVGANYAAAPPDMTFDLTEYRGLIAGDAEGINCGMETPPPPEYTTPTGDPAPDPVIGDYATVKLTCHFEPLTALSALFVGDDVLVEAETIFPMRYGCVDCPAPLAAGPPTAPPDPCRLLPQLEGMSVAGARLAWVSAGFSQDQFTTSGNETAQVLDVFATEEDPDASCDPGYYTFSSSVFVTSVDPSDGSCATVPNLIGTVVADARQAWTDAGFSADNFSPPDQDAQVVTNQDTDPDSNPGVSCAVDFDAATTTVTVDTGDPWPEAPPAPCQVPNLIDQTRTDAALEWALAGFSTDNFNPPGGGWKVKWQSLVGGDLMGCGSPITVSQKP